MSCVLEQVNPTSPLNVSNHRKQFVSTSKIFPPPLTLFSNYKVSSVLRFFQYFGTLLPFSHIDPFLSVTSHLPRSEDQADRMRYLSICFSCLYVVCATLVLRCNYFRSVLLQMVSLRVTCRTERNRTWETRENIWRRKKIVSSTQVAISSNCPTLSHHPTPTIRNMYIFECSDMSFARKQFVAEKKRLARFRATLSTLLDLSQFFRTQ